MKKILTLLALMLTCVSGAFAGIFENSKIVVVNGDSSLVTIDSYSANATIFETTSDIAEEAQSVFAEDLFVRISGIIYKIDGITNAAATPNAGDKYVSNVSQNKKYIALYKAIKDAKDVLPTIELADHAAIGSKAAAASSASAASQTAVGDITNNNPYAKLEEAINTAEEALKNTTSSDKVYEDATATLVAAADSYAQMFDKLETLRDSLIILKDFYENDVVAATGKKYSEYPAADAIFGAGWDNAISDYANAVSFAIVNSDVELVIKTQENLVSNAANYSAEDLAFLDNVKNAQAAESKNGYPVIANIGTAEYALFIKVPTMQMVDAGTKLAEEISKATGTAPLINYTSIAIASAKFAASMTFAGQLMAENIKHMQTLQACIDYLNTECQYDEAYYFLTQEVDRSKMNLRTCDNSAVAELQHGILKDALQHAKDLDAYDVSLKALEDKINEAQDIYDNEMEYKRADNTTKVQARQNLIKYIREAEKVANRQYVVKRVDYTYPDAGEVSLYTFDWVNGAGVSYNLGQDETPSQIIVRETTKMQNAIDYCKKQYGLENTIDDAIEYRDSIGLFKSPKDSVATVIIKAEAFNNGITLRQYQIAQIDSVVNAIIGTLELARERQQIISDSLAYIQQVVDESVNNIPTDSLKDALIETTEKLMNNESDWDDVKDLLDELYQGSVKEQIADEPQNYSAYMIARVEKWLQENDRYKDLTPAQLSVIYKALSAAKTALAEFYDPRYQTYDELKRTYLLKRMYYSSLALEDIEKMTVASPVNPDLATQQLAEALAVYACYAASQYDETIDEEAVKEGNRIFKEGNAAQKTQAAARLYALLNQYNAATGINAANGKGQILNGKVVENGRVVIIKNGKKYTTTGVAL